MNVLEAIDKLNEINNKISSLVKVITKLDGDSDFHSEKILINEIKNGLVKEAESLKQRLENTQLINMR